MRKRKQSGAAEDWVECLVHRERKKGCRQAVIKAASPLAHALRRSAGCTGKSRQQAGTKALAFIAQVCWQSRDDDAQCLREGLVKTESAAHSASVPRPRDTPLARVSIAPADAPRVFRTQHSNSRKVTFVSSFSEFPSTSKTAAR